MAVENLWKTCGKLVEKYCSHQKNQRVKGLENEFQESPLAISLYHIWILTSICAMMRMLG